MYSFCQFLTYEKTINECTDYGDNHENCDSEDTCDQTSPRSSTNENEQEGIRIPTLHKRIGLATVAKFFSVFRAWICLWQLEKFSNSKIGGHELTVEIDESKFGEIQSFLYKKLKKMVEQI